jgi:AcrR family transcriptional regulator
MKALTRKEKQARTRAKLMRSAAKLFCRHGLEQASVDDIAQDAGFTKGAFYSNFKSKEELFLAMLDEKFGEEIDRIESALQADEAPDEAARHAGEAFVRSVRADREWERLYFEFIAYASRNEDFRQEFLTRCLAMNERLEEVYRRWHDRVGITAPMPLRDITSMVSIMADGFLLWEHLDPSLDEELFGTMLAIFMQGLGAIAQEQAPAGAATGGAT